MFFFFSFSLKFFISCFFFVNRESIQNINVLLQSFYTKSESFCFVKSVNVFEIVPPCCPRKVAGIGKVVWCRILVTGIFELISDFSNIKSKFKQKGNANLSRSNVFGATLLIGHHTTSTLPYIVPYHTYLKLESKLYKWPVVALWPGVLLDGSGGCAE